MNSARIWKFPLPIVDGARVSMPDGARVVALAVVDEQPFLWAVVDPAAPVGDVGEYIATFHLQGGSLVFHVFDGAP